MALVLTRTPGESVRFFLGDRDLGRVTVREGVRRGEVKLVFDCPRDLRLLRDELPPHPPPTAPALALVPEDSANDFAADLAA